MTLFTGKINPYFSRRTWTLIEKEETQKIIENVR